MSCKLSMNNSIKTNSDPQQWLKTASIDSNVKLAGEEAKDRLYEPKHKKKLVRVLTVVAYVFFVSLAAIMLSLYYVFLWNGNQRDTSKNKQEIEKYTSSLCKNRGVLLDVLYEPTAIPVVEATTLSALPTSPDDQNEQESWPEYSRNYTNKLGEISKSSPFLKKLIFSSAIEY